MLSLLIFLPIAVAALLGLMPGLKDGLAKTIGIAASAVTLLVSLAVLTGFKSSGYNFQLAEHYEWIPSLGISYYVAVDGISVWLVVLTTLLSLIAIIYGLGTISEKSRLFAASVLALEGAMLGAFLSLDLVLFFTFFELTLIPMWIMIVTWGGPNRAKAAFKFVAFTFAGSIFFLIGMGILAFMYHQTTRHISFSVPDIQLAVANGSLWTKFALAQPWLFWSFAVAFLVKAPSFPLHGWISDTYAESPAVGPILSCAMVKLGSYGLLRFCLPLFPDAVQSAAPILAGLAVAGIVYGAIVACVQTDMRRMLAYSTVSHMGFVLLGIFSLSHAGLVGGSLQQFSHGVSASLLFLLVAMLIQRRGSADFKDFGGLKAATPLLATTFLIGMLASVGLPGLNGFVGEFLALFGAFQSGFNHLAGLDASLAAVAGLGVVIAAVYLLYMYQQVFYGELKSEENKSMLDLTPREFGLASVLVFLAFVGGLMPKLFTDGMEESLSGTRQMVLNPNDEKPTWNQRRAKRKVQIEAQANKLNGEVAKL